MCIVHLLGSPWEILPLFTSWPCWYCCVCYRYLTWLPSQSHNNLIVFSPVACLLDFMYTQMTSNIHTLMLWLHQPRIYGIMAVHWTSSVLLAKSLLYMFYRSRNIKLHLASFHFLANGIAIDVLSSTSVSIDPTVLIAIISIANYKLINWRVIDARCTYH